MRFLCLVSCLVACGGVSAVPDGAADDTHTVSTEASIDASQVDAATVDASTTDAATASPASGVKWHPGMGMFSSILTTLGNRDNALNPAGDEKAAEISALRASPEVATMWLGTYSWRAINNAKGTIDGSSAGSGLDADYVTVTGWKSGTREHAVYDAPRRMAIAIFTQDYFSSDPTARAVPDYIVNDASYGAVGPDGKHYGYFTTQGAAGPGTSAFAAMWRPSVAGAYATFMQDLATHVLPDGYTVDTSPYVEFIMAYGELSDEPELTNGTTGYAADSSFANEGAFYSQVESMSSSIVSSFPHTVVMLNNNYSAEADNAVSLADYFASHAISFGSGDTFGLTSGTNVCNGLCGETFAQLLYRGEQPSSSPYSMPWVSGGTSEKGAVPMIGLGSNTELIESYGAYYTPQDIFDQADFVGFTHLVYAYTMGLSGQDASGHDMSTANWFGSASDATQWNTAPGKWGGVLDAIYNDKLSNNACPSAYAACSTN